MHRARATPIPTRRSPDNSPRCDRDDRGSRSGRGGSSLSTPCRPAILFGRYSWPRAATGAPRFHRCPASSACRSIWSWRRPRKPWRSAFRRSRCFPTPIPSKRTDDGREALNPDNLVCRATRGDPQGAARHRHPARRGARPLHEPWPRRADARTARSSTTRRSRRWSASRWCRSRPVATSSRRPT